MSDDVKSALGTQLKIGTAVTAVAGLTSISGLDLSADTIDTTTLDGDGYRTFIGGLKDGGEVSIEGYLIPATGKGQQELYTLFDSGEVEDFTIEFPADTKAKWEFEGIVTGFSTSADLEDPLAFSATIKVSGEPTLTVTT